MPQSLNHFTIPVSLNKVYIRLFHIKKTNLTFLDIEQVDFQQTQKTAKDINAWCAAATKNHIKDIVTPGLYHAKLANKKE